MRHFFQNRHEILVLSPSGGGNFNLSLEDGGACEASAEEVSGGGGGPGSAGYVIWRPGVPSAGQAVETFAELAPAIENGAQRIYFDSSVAPCTTPGTGQTLDCQGFVGFSAYNLLPGVEGSTLTISDTDVILNLGDVTTLVVVCECTTTPCFNWTGSLALPQFSFAYLTRPLTATVSAYKVPGGQTFSPWVGYGTSIEETGGNTHAPFFGVASGGASFPFITLTSFLTATSFGCDAGGVQELFVDDTVTGTIFTPTFAAGTFVVNLLSSDQLQSYGSGDAFPASPRVGQPFLRTDLNAKFTFSDQAPGQGGSEGGWTSPGNIGFVQTTDTLPAVLASFVPGTAPTLLAVMAVQCTQSGRVSLTGSLMFECSAPDSPTIAVRMLNTTSPAPPTTAGGTNIQNATAQAGAFIVSSTAASPVVPTPDPSTGALGFQGTTSTDVLSGDNLAVMSIQAEFGSMAVGNWLVVGIYGSSTSETTEWNVNTVLRLQEKPN